MGDSEIEHTVAPALEKKKHLVYVSTLSHVRKGTSSSDNTLSHPNLLIVSFFLFRRFLTFCYLAALNCWLLVFPATLSHDWQMGSVPLVTSLADSRNLSTCLFFAFLLVLIYKGIVDFEVSVTLKLYYVVGELEVISLANTQRSSY